MTNICGRNYLRVYILYMYIVTANVVQRSSWTRQLVLKLTCDSYFCITLVQLQAIYKEAKEQEDALRQHINDAPPKRPDLVRTVYKILLHAYIYGIIIQSVICSDLQCVWF